MQLSDVFASGYEVLWNIHYRLKVEYTAHFPFEISTNLNNTLGQNYFLG